MQEMWVQSWVLKIRWRRKWQPTPVFLPGEIHGEKEASGSPWGCKRVRRDLATKQQPRYAIVYGYHIFFIYSSVSGYLGCLQGLAVVNNAAVNVGVHISCWIKVFSRYMPRSEMTGSYHSSMFTFLRTLHAVLLSGYIILHSSPAVQEGALFSTPCPAFIVCTFFYNGHLTGMRGYLTVVLICIFLIISNVECLFICSLALCMSLLWRNTYLGLLCIR